MVMASFWDLAARINARRVLLWICVGCVTLLGTIMLRTRLVEDGTTSTFLIARPAPEPTAVTPPDTTPSAARPIPTKDPFASSFLHELIERAERLRREQEAARQRVQERPPEVATASPPPVQGPPRPEARLLYRGMFTRPDGSVLALIENQRDSRTLFHRMGDKIEGLTIGAISRDALELLQENQPKVTLPIGAPTSFQPDK